MHANEPDTPPEFHLLPHPAPDNHVARGLLVAMRRMASDGLDDATATNIIITTCGLGYRRALMFLRVFMAEVARVATRRMTMAPCCSPRMTDSEATLLLTIAVGSKAPDLARAALVSVTGTPDCLTVLSAAQALGSALEDLGRPLTL